ncbi:hypothetical protein [Nocardia sp. NPDC058633]|uniref:hypothetical protein n=1 Tax=Nocardia sp. NPDC058633 TaxID=3346568 RepID=UPI00364C6736
MTILSATALSSTACGMITASGGSAESVSCTTEFRFGTAEPLGLISRFADQSNAAAETGDPTTLRAIADSAGWQGGWDRLVEVPQDITTDELNRRTGTTSACWENMPTKSDAGGPTKGYYLFLNGTQPIQTTSWYGKADHAISFEGAEQILADTPLIGTGQGALRPA